MVDKIKLKFIELKREPSACGHVGSHVAPLQSLEVSASFCSLERERIVLLRSTTFLVFLTTTTRTKIITTNFIALIIFNLVLN